MRNRLLTNAWGTKGRNTTMSLLIAFLMVVGHDPRKLGRKTSQIAWPDLAFVFAFFAVVALFLSEVLLA
jgi:hypothetical protein